MIKNQHGFRSGRATITDLIDFSTYALDAFELHQQVDVIYMDFSKEFDKIEHINMLIFILDKREPYPYDRFQFVDLLNNKSENVKHLV